MRDKSTQRPAASSPKRQKYRQISTAILVFIFLDLGVLILNLSLSYELQDDAWKINITGRQRMLSQRMVKALDEIELFREQGRPYREQKKELNYSVELFEQSLNALHHGGQTLNIDQTPVVLKALGPDEQGPKFGQALSLWADYKDKLRAVVLAPDPIPKDILDPATLAARANNLQLLAFMNEVTTELQQKASARAQVLRTIQTLAIVLASINFFYIIITVLRKLRQQDQKEEDQARQVQATNDQLNEVNRKLESANKELSVSKKWLIEAQQECDLIFCTVREGIFLLNKDLTLGNRNSLELTLVFGLRDLRGASFLEMLKPLITPAQLQAAGDYLPRLFLPNSNKKELQSLNPLARIKANFNQPGKDFKTLHLEFKFMPIVGIKGVERVLVSMYNNTEQVNLMRRLNVEEKRSLHESQTLCDILRIERKHLLETLNDAERTIFELKLVQEQPNLNTGRQSQKLFELEQTCCLIQNLRSNAASLGFSTFKNAAFNIENSMKKVIASDCSPEDLDGALHDLENLQVMLKELQATEAEIEEHALNLSYSSPAA